MSKSGCHFSLALCFLVPVKCQVKVLLVQKTDNVTSLIFNNLIVVLLFGNICCKCNCNPTGA